MKVTSRSGETYRSSVTSQRRSERVVVETNEGPQQMPDLLSRLGVTASEFKADIKALEAQGSFDLGPNREEGIGAITGV